MKASKSRVCPGKDPMAGGQGKLKIWKDFNLLVVLGPTASGKTRLGVRLAGACGGEIISADSRQVYRGMDLGTGKDLDEYGKVPYHLIDILDPGDDFSVFHFQQECLAVVAQLHAKGTMPVLVGGTGLYLESILKGYRMVAAPENHALRDELSRLSMDLLVDRLQSLSERLHNSTDLASRERLIRAIEIAECAADNEPEPFPPLSPLVFGIRWERGELRRRITERLRERLDQGMIDEVARLHAAGIPWDRLDYFGLEYRFVGRHLRGELNRNELFQVLNSAIHDFAKRQETWFRRMERNGVVINWLDGAGDPYEGAVSVMGCNGG